MEFLKFEKIYLAIGALAIAASIAVVAVFGLRFGIDFTGGSVLEITYQTNRPAVAEIQKSLSELNAGTLYIQPIGENNMVVRMSHISEDTHQLALSRLGSEAKEVKFESVGPAIGKELRSKTLQMAFVALAVILLYVTFAFRKAIEYARSWQYGVTVLLTALHDVLIPLGALALLGKFSQVEINIPVVVALLTVLGYSINDTIVVFDRVRENVIRRTGADFRDTVNKSLRQMFLRCVNTYLTTLFPLAALYAFGGETLKYFSLSLIIGIAAGVYSSLFLAPSFLIRWVERRLT